MKKNTVLIVGPTPPPMGGIATYVENLLKSNINDGYDILHLNTRRKHSIKKSLIKNVFLFFRNTSKLIYLIVFKHPKIVHIHTSSYMAFWEKSVFLVISKILFKKVIIHIHGGGFSDFYQNNQIPLGKLFISNFLNISDKVIVLSDSWKTYFKQILPDSKICVIHNAVNYYLYSFKKSYNFENEGFIRVLFAGYLSKDKGIYDILKSIPFVLKSYPNILFVFAGMAETSGEFDLITKCVKELNVEKNISFIGMLSKQEMIEAYKKSDIFLLPSYIEGLPMTILEAMAAGLPIISTPVGGIPDIIVEGENGLLIAPGNYVELANKIIELCNDSELRIVMGQNNSNKIKNKYEWSIVATQISNIYQELLA